jgi:hypothetical protein
MGRCAVKQEYDCRLRLSRRCGQAHLRPFRVSILSGED